MRREEGGGGENGRRRVLYMMTSFGLVAFLSFLRILIMVSIWLVGWWWWRLFL